MPNLVQHLRSSTPNSVPNTEQISIGEIALNLTDRKIFTSNGSAVFELGANVVDLEITGSLTANGSLGTDGQVLTTNGSAVFWADSTANGGGGGGISNVVEDTSPQLGGDLDANNNQIFLSDGSVDNPALSFSTSPNTGFYLINSNVVSFSLNGTRFLDLIQDGVTYQIQFGAGFAQINNLGVGSFTNLSIGAGTVSAPSLWVGDNNTGIYRPTSDTLAITSGGVEGLRVAESGSAITITANGNLNVVANLSANAITANTLQNADIKNYTVVTGTPDANSGSITFNYSDGPDFHVTLTGNVTAVAFSNLPATNLAKMSIKFIQASDGGNEVDLSSINFGNANTPAMPVTNNAIMEIVAWSRDGNNVFGAKTFEYDGS